MRSIFLYLSQQRSLRRWMEQSPISQKLTRRFVAGETLQNAIAVSRRLDGEKIFATLDHLGENVHSAGEAAISRDSYLAALDQIEASGLKSTVSIKLTQFGLDLSDGECLRNVRALVARAKEMGSRVEIDMESSEYTDRTLAVVRAMHEEFQCIRAVIQAYLFRSEADIQSLNAAGIPVRLCKGAYNEPPAVAIPSKTAVDANYVKLMKLLLDHGTYPAIASHDETILGDARRYIRERAIPAEKFEFQMLYGIRRDLQRDLVRQGYRLRIYVPYGDAWYPYFMRRLAERPANVVFLLKNLVKR